MTTDAKATPRTFLAEQRAKALEKTKNIVLPVPNYDDIVVKYRAVSVDEVRKANDGVSKLPKGMQSYEASARVLANACQGIYRKVDGLYESVLGAEEEVPTFTYELAVALMGEDNLPERGKLTAAGVVKLFYVTDLDTISTADALADKSGARRIEAEEDFLER